MIFSKEDGLTFLIGLAGGSLVVLAESLINFSEAMSTGDLGTWASSLGIGLVVAAGRYLKTRIPELVASQGANTTDHE